MLLVAAVEEFASKGFHATTTRDIAGRAGMSPAALYVHYPSKTTLLAEIIKLGHQSALEAFEQSLRDTSSPVDRLAATVHAFTVWNAANRKLARVVQYELDALPANERRAVGALRTHFEELLHTEIKRGDAEGLFSVEDVEGTATAVFSLCIDVARWYSPRYARSPEEIGLLYRDLALRMVGYTG
jgi:AcrR family transcriptional regulator